MVYICKRIKEVIYTANSSKEAETRKYGKNIMKTTIDFLNGLNFKNTANFQNNVIKTLPEGVEKVYLSTVGMKRLGTGSYNFFLDVEINGIDITLKYFTNSSPAWDFWTDLELGTRSFENWAKQTTLMILEEKKDEIIELISEEENE